MLTTLKHLLLSFVTASALFVIGCGAQSSAQQSNSELTQIEMRCNALAATSKQDYRLLSGRVVEAQKHLWSGNCGSRDCHLDTPAFFSAVLVTPSDERIRVYTLDETYRTLDRKPPYMHIGQQYQFCARPREHSVPSENFDHEYQIDSIGTILEQPISREEARSRTMLRCDALSATSEHQYQALSGTAIVVKKSFWPGDCFKEDCHLDKPAHFFALFEPSEGGPFRITTASETFRTLHPKVHYMDQGNYYSFCARQMPVRGSPRHNHKVFQIDFIETIQQSDWE